jgi:membrane associated rhomboid family serine protease
MKAISRWLDRFCYKHPRFGIPNLMKFIVIGNVLVYFMDMFSNGYATLMFLFHPDLIFQGQVWRIITFLFVPVSGYSSSNMFSILWFAMTTLFYYYIGNALERQWGSTRFTVFYFLGAILNLIIGFAFQTSVTMYYVNMSMFFAFATLYPEMQVLLYGILPLKVKWLAWLDAALFLYDIIRYLMLGAWGYALIPVVAILNYFIFFWDDLMSIVRRKTGRMAYQARPQTINFKKAQKEVQQRKGYLHKCAVCGITDADDPNMEFRYCSKCNGYYCYCMKHINDHVHVQ